jgi:hypothetical protein
MRKLGVKPREKRPAKSRKRAKEDHRDWIGFIGIGAVVAVRVAFANRASGLFQSFIR